MKWSIRIQGRYETNETGKMFNPNPKHICSACDEIEKNEKGNDLHTPFAYSSIFWTISDVIRWIFGTLLSFLL